MRIDKIEMYRVCNPIKRPYITAFGAQNAFNSIVVKLESDGIAGWGESCPGGMGESSLGTTVVANLATLPNVNYPSDISPADKFYVENLGNPVLLTEQPGTYTMRDKPGLDVEPDFAVLAKYKQEEFFA